MKVCFWGTYDTGKPRVRILLAGLRRNGCGVVECHAHVWKKHEDKSQISGIGSKLRILLAILLSYPVLLVRHAFSERQDIVICGYPGNFDILVMWPLAKIRREKLALDAFIPVYDTVVDDRKLVQPNGMVARLIHLVEGMSCRAADIVIVDTKAHGEYFASEFGVDPGRIVRAYVGCEPDFFHAAGKPAQEEAGRVPIVLFYGQFIPLHGIRTIIEAARLCRDAEIRWRIIGTGQEADGIRDMLRDAPVCRLEWIPWVDYAALRGEIEQAAVCLGIFGTSKKAGRVIPNKVFQIAACGKPIVTRDSAAIRELFDGDAPGLILVPPGDPAALCAAVRQAVESGGSDGYADGLLGAITPQGIGADLMARFRNLSETSRAQYA